jgi:tight adherence protein C
MDFVLVLIVLAAFLAVSTGVWAAGEYVGARIELRRRLPAGATMADSQAQRRGSGLGELVTAHFTEERFGVDSKLRQKLRRELLRAGFFDPLATRYYVFARFCTVVMLPVAVFFIFGLVLPGAPFFMLMIAVMATAGIGVLAPDAYLSRRQSKLQHNYRLIFPDLLDLLVICVAAGLSVEASFDRIREPLSRRNSFLGQNIELMGTEMRAGRSSIEALNSLADRLGLDEAASFVAVLRHSIALGADVASSLRVFSEEMRSRRMLLAEKKANELPVKMVLPLALGIFPVILMIVLLPIVVKLSTILK